MIVGGYERNPGAVVPRRRHPADVQQHAPRSGLGSVRADRRGRPGGRAGARRRRRDPADQRTGGVHARRRVHPRRERGRRVLRRRRLLRPRHRRRRWRRQGDGRVDRRSRAADGPVEDGRPPLRAAVPQPRLLPRPHRRDLQHLLRHRVPEPRTARRPAAEDAARVRAATTSSGPSSARRAAGSASTGTAATRIRRTSTSGRVAGPGSTGRRRSSPSISRRVRPPGCSTSRASPRSRSTGSGAAAFLERICTNHVDRAVGSITYTSMLNSRGGIECDVTVTRLSLERFLIVTGTAFGRHDRSWIEQHAPTDGSVMVRDVTSSMACFALWGPAARDILSAVCADDLTFRYMQARHVTVGDVPCWALRVTYVGELGWELYPTIEYGVRLWDTLLEAGRPLGLVPGGYRAIDSLRDREGLPGLGRGHHERDRPVLVGARVRRARRQGVPRRGRPCPLRQADRRGWCASCSTTCGRSRSATSRCVTPTEPSSGASRAAASATRSNGRSRTRWLPAAHAEVGTRLSVEVFGEVGRCGGDCGAAVRPRRPPHPRLTPSTTHLMKFRRPYAAETSRDQR